MANPGTERGQQSSILVESVKEKDDLLEQLESQIEESAEGNFEVIADPMMRQEHIPHAAKNCECQATLLIVDDSAFNLIPLKMLLKNMGITCDQALGGQQAIDLFIANRNKTCC